MLKRTKRGLGILVVIALAISHLSAPGFGAGNSLSKSVAGWIPYWDQTRALTSVQNNPDVFDQLSPFWYDLGSSGQVIPLPNSEDSALISYAKTNGKKLIPLISNEFDPVLISNILNSSSLQQTLINNIVNKVVAMDYTGFEIDFENIYSKNQTAFTTFIRNLAAALHSRGKVLVVTLQAKTSDTNTWNGPGAQDYAAIGQAADLIRVMAYDYHWNTSPAGSIAPATWVEQVLAYTVNKVPAAKVVLGVPDYGYDWVGSKGKGITYSQAITAATTYKATIVEDANNGPHYTYWDSSGNYHEVWFQNANSVTTLIKLANKYNVNGIAIWRLGGEDFNIYMAIRNAFPVTQQTTTSDSSTTISQGTTGTTSTNSSSGTTEATGTTTTTSSSGTTGTTGTTSSGTTGTNTTSADTVPPSVFLSYTAYKTSITITANASDNAKVTKVEIYFDGNLIATDSAPPYVTYYKKKRTNANHIVKAIAYDTAGNTSTSQITFFW